MDCRECQNLLAAYVAGDLPADRSAMCDEHLASCPDCRAELACYRRVTDALAGAPALQPSIEESAALARALDEAVPAPAAVQRAQFEAATGSAAFTVASVAAFFVVALTLGAQSLGLLDLARLASPVVLLTAMGGAAVVLVVTTLVPIAVTAKRRPLNGMTFRA